MKKWKVLLSGIAVLILPFIGIGVARVFWGKVIFDNPEFWYSYMAYFGTVSLALVSWLQSIKTEEISNGFIKQQLRQKIGYFELKQESGEIKKIRKYQLLQNGQFLTSIDGNDKTKGSTLGIWLKNVGEDIILNVRPIFGKINGESVNVPCAINVIYKSEEILFELDNTKSYKESEIKIDFLIQMENSAGILYEQSIYIGAKRGNATIQGTYLIQEFDTHIKFID